MTTLIDWRTMGEIHREGLNVGERTHRFIESTHRHQHSLYICVLNNRHASLDALARIGHRFLIGALAGTEPLKTNFQARLVHHGKHARQSVVFLTDEVANRSAIVAIGHDTGGTAVNTELVLDRYGVGVIALTQACIVIHKKLRNDEQRDTFASCRSIG